MSLRRQPTLVVLEAGSRMPRPVLP